MVRFMLSFISSMRQSQSIEKQTMCSFYFRKASTHMCPSTLEFVSSQFREFVKNDLLISMCYVEIEKSMKKACVRVVTIGRFDNVTTATKVVG